MANAPRKKYTLMIFDHLTIDDIDVLAPETYAAARAELKALVLGQQGPDSGISRYEKLELNKPRFSLEDGLSIDQIHITDATQIVRRTADGDWNAVRLINIIKAIAATDQTAEKQDKKT